MFLDRNLGKKIIADALRQAGADVRLHDDYFSPTARDEEWLSEVGRRQWVVLTKDEPIGYREIERTALMNAGVRALVLIAKNLQGSEMANIFARHCPQSNDSPPGIPHPSLRRSPEVEESLCW